MNTDRTLWINARFIDRPVTGVERVARELLGALARDHLDAEGIWRAPDGSRWRLRLLAPRQGTATSPWSNLPLLRRGRFGGHLWEQLSLPWLTRGAWLFSPCNTTALCKRRQLLFLHDAQPLAIPQNFSWRFRSWYRVLYSVAGRCAAVVLTNSEFSRNELVRHLGLRAAKLRVCLLGCDHMQRLPEDSAGVQRRGLPSAPFLLAVSSRSPNKNFAAVATALQQLGSAAPECVVVGQENPQIFAAARVDGTPLRHLGYVSDGELVALYRRALALAYPSFYEGFGLPPLEAMSQGCPAILARSSSLPEVGGDAAMYCDPSDPATLAAAIARVNTDAALRADLAARGQARAAGFTWGRCAAAFLDAFAAATGGSR